MKIPKRLALERGLYQWSKRLWRLTGRLHPGVCTPLSVAGRPVFMIHNPKCAGTSLKPLLGVEARRTTHSLPRDLFRRGLWETGIFVVAIRHPFDRFLSSWRYHCQSGYRGKLVKRHGDLSQLSPLEYFAFIRQYPENCGLQGDWVTYPSPTKPECDIVLRTEESARWSEILAQHGIPVQSPTTPRLNASRENLAISAYDLGPHAHEFDELRQRVEDHYRSDYLRFGYAFGPPSAER